jgi:hypothetical protein
VRGVAALLVLLLTTIIAAPVTCAGWEGAPESRRECCKRAHHASCHDQSAADNCCAGHEQGRVATMTAAGSVASVPPLTLLARTFDSTALESPATVIYSTLLSERLHGPPNLLVLPLRI